MYTDRKISCKRYSHRLLLEGGDVSLLGRFGRFLFFCLLLGCSLFLQCLSCGLFTSCCSAGFFGLCGKPFLFFCSFDLGAQPGFAQV